MIVELPIEENDFEIGQELLAFFEQQFRFVQQSARLDSIDFEAGQQVVTLRLLSETVSAEFRECYRVSAVVARISARVGPSDECAVVNVSSIGIAVISRGRYRIGEVLNNAWC